MVNPIVLSVSLLSVCFCPVVRAAGGLDLHFNPNVGGEVQALAVAPEGQILIGGSFGSVGGKKTTTIARLLPDGSLDPGWSTAAGKAVSSCAVLADGGVLAGAWFPGHEGIARLFPDGSTDPAFTARVSEGGVRAMSVDAGGNLVLAGDFHLLNGKSHGGLGSLTADGELRETPRAGPGKGESVLSVVPRWDGSLLFGGDFDTLNGRKFFSLAKMFPGGATLDPLFLPPLPAGDATVVRCLATQRDGRIVAGGSFRSVVDGVTLQSGLMRFLANGQLDTSFRPVFWRGQENATVTSVAIQADGKILAAGDFTMVNGIASQGVVRLTSAGTFDLSFTAAAPGATGLALQADGMVLVTGTFTTVNGVTRNRIARLLNDPVKETLSIRQNRVSWSRGGSAPESDLVGFETSADGGATWQPVGTARRSDGNWSATGSLPASGILRARARVGSGIMNGSSGLLEKRVNYTLKPEIHVREWIGSDLIDLTDGQAAPVTFGEIRQGSPEVRTVEIYNGGTANLAVNAIHLPPGFTWRNPVILPAFIDPSQSFAISIQADAAALGALAGVVRIESNDEDEASFEFPLSALVTGPDIAVHFDSKALSNDRAAPVPLGRAYQGTTPAYRPFVISNQGTRNLEVAGITATDDFVVEPVPPFTLPPGTSRAVGVAPVLNAAGTLSGVLQIVSDDADALAFRVPLAASAVNPLAARLLKKWTKWMPRNGFHRQTVRISNPTATATIPGFRVVLRGLPAWVQVRNASEILPDGSVVVEVLQPLGPGQRFDLVLEYFMTWKMPVVVAPKVTTEVIPGIPPALAAVSPRLAVEKCERTCDGHFAVTFRSVPGRRYQVEYSADGREWKSAPPTRAAGSKLRWVDCGCPYTDCAPATVARRLYRVRELD